MQYQSLFSLEISHRYHASGKSEDFHILPTYRCAENLRDAGLIFRSHTHGFLVQYQARNGNDPKIPLTDQTKYSFILHQQRPDLLNFSDLPLSNQVNQIYYLDNLTKNRQEDALLLTAETGHEFLSGLDILSLRPQSFQYRFSSSRSRVSLQIQDVFGRTIEEALVPVHDGSGSYPVALRRLSPGKFTLRLDGELAETFYASDELFRQKPFGVLDIYQHARVPSEYQFTDLGDPAAITPRKYQLNIQRRTTYWKYLFVHKYRLTELNADDWPDSWPDDYPDSLPAGWQDAWPEDWPAEWVIRYPSDPVVHMNPVPQQARALSDGYFAIPFISESPLPLSDKSIAGIELTKREEENDEEDDSEGGPPWGRGGPGRSRGHNGNHRGSGIRAIQNLPNASPRTLVVNNEEGKIYSEIFVYV
ncbi:MAG TPA: hypothetical protein VKA68_09475 [bacterium]|nr:hypothetical protein [bacterium]